MPDGAIDFSSLSRSLSEFTAAKAEYLVEDLFFHPSLTLLFAPSGGQKSLLALDMARAVATGGSFLGSRCRRTPVVYVDGEMSDRSIGMRAEAMGIAELSRDDFAYITPQGNEMDFSCKQVRSGFIEFIENTEYRFIVFDNLRVLMTTGSENDSENFTVFNTFIRQLRDLGCSVLVIHHANKGGNDYAGSTNVLTVFDCAIGLKGGSTDKYKQVTLGKPSRDATKLNTLEGQYVSYDPAGFRLNAHAGQCIESAVEALVESIKAGDTTTIIECGAFLRTKGVSVNNSGWNYQRLLDEFIQPYYVGGDIDSLAALKALLSQSRAK